MFEATRNPRYNAATKKLEMMESNDLWPNTCTGQFETHKDIINFDRAHGVKTWFKKRHYKRVEQKLGRVNAKFGKREQEYVDDIGEQYDYAFGYGVNY